jgi:steroid delta-isomerase-like uncharacterized protein
VTGRALERGPAEQLAERWRSAWLEASAAGFAACCSASVRYEDPVATEPLEGLDALARHAERLHEAFPDLRIEQSAGAVVDSAHGCLPWRFIGTHRGAIGPLPATKRFVTLHGLHFVELADGRVRRARGFFDLYDAAVQLGLLPTRGGLGEAAILFLRGFGFRPRA